MTNALQLKIREQVAIDPCRNARDGLFDWTHELLTEERAFRSAFNQRRPWWNCGASHMNHTFRKAFFDRLSLVSLLGTMRRLQCVSNHRMRNRMSGGVRGRRFNPASYSISVWPGLAGPCLINRAYRDLNRITGA